MARRVEIIDGELTDEEALALILKGEEPAPPPERVKEPLPLGSIVFVLEEIDKGKDGRAAFQGREVTVQTLELVHRYANAIVIVQPNFVKEYGSPGAAIKAPARSLEDMNDVAASIDRTITTVLEVDVSTLLSDRVPRFIRILADQDATLEFQTPRTSRTTYPEGLDANIALEISNEAWIKMWITPTVSTLIQIYMSTSSAVGAE